MTMGSMGATKEESVGTGHSGKRKDEHSTLKVRKRRKKKNRLRDLWVV